MSKREPMSFEHTQATRRGFLVLGVTALGDVTGLGQHRSRGETGTERVRLADRRKRKWEREFLWQVSD